jgi:hypothetical protein
MNLAHDLDISLRISLLFLPMIVKADVRSLMDEDHVTSLKVQVHGSEEIAMDDVSCNARLHKSHHETMENEVGVFRVS